MRIKRPLSMMLLALVVWLQVPFSRAALTDDEKTLHLLNRITYGPRPGDIEQVKAIGLERYLKAQLHPEQVTESSGVSWKLGQLETLRMNPVELFQKYRQPLQNIDRKQDPEAAKAFLKESMVIVQQASQARLLRATESEKQLQEVMTDFWFNHFNVYAAKGLDRIWIGAYEEQAIRPHAMGRFRDLLSATARHPAMLYYLDNWLNTAPNSPGSNKQFQGLNENYARELLELHTLGVDGGYTQKDVVELARVLTGWGIPTPNLRQNLRQNGNRAQKMQALQNLKSTGFFFDAARHDYGDKVLLGQRIRGTGQAEVEQALDILSRHPATARHIAYKLAQAFVADTPPQSLIDRLSLRYQQTDGDIRAMLDTLFHSPEFWEEEYVGAKFKSPYRYVISTLRASDLEVSNYWLLAGLLKQMGMPLYGCETPNGYKNTQEAWLSPDALSTRLNYAVALSGGYLPLNQPFSADTVQLKGFKTQLGKAMQGRQAFMPPVKAETVAASMNHRFSEKTQSVLQNTPERLRASVILGSPEFMKY